MTLEKMKFYIVTPSAATNYVTNPTPYKATTGYTAVGGSIAVDDTYSRRGPASLQVTPTTSESGVYFGTVSVVNTQDYGFSVDIKGESGKAMRIQVEDADATYTYETTFTATGEWQRIQVEFTAEEDANDYRLYVLRDATIGTTVFHVDGFQFEDDEVTTFFTGDTQGFGTGKQEFYWGGTPHASVSYRTANTNAGGVLLDIEDYAYETITAYGLGSGTYIQLLTDLINGGSYYQGYIRKQRNFSLLAVYNGGLDALQSNRNIILDAVRPTGQKMVVRYQGLDSSDGDATEPVDIICVPQPSYQDTADNPIYQKAVLNFTIPSGVLNGAYTEGGELADNDTLVVDGIVMRDSDGNWSNMDGGLDDGRVDCIAEAPNGDIYIGGTFTGVNGVANTAKLARWDGYTWSTVTGVNTINNVVCALCFDADGNLYIGGVFTDLGGANGNGIVKWDGSNLFFLDTGISGGLGMVDAIVIDPSTGYIYIGGSFTSAGGIANTGYIAYWDGAAWNALGTGMGGTVLGVDTMIFDTDSNLYIGGSFTGADGSGNADYICYWDGINFNMVGNVELNGNVDTIAFDNIGNLYAGGEFVNAGNNTNADYIAKFNGSQWANLGAGVNNYVYKIFIKNKEIYVSGPFSVAGRLTLTDRVAYYSSGSWRMLDIDLLGSPLIYSIFIDSHDSLYVGGNVSGNAITNDITTITNNGDLDAYPTVEIVGPGILQSLTNYTTGKEIQFNGLTLQSGEMVKLYLDPLNLKFVSDWRGDCMRYVIPGSDRGEFVLESGENNIGLFMPSGTDANTKAYIYWTPLFDGIEGAKYD